MTRCVVDASALAALLFLEPGAEEVAGRLDGADLVAPTLLPYELASVAAKKLAAGEDEEAITFGLRLIESLDVDWQPVEPLSAALLARELGVTAYDAAYLWLALQDRAGLITLDQELQGVWDGLEDSRTP